VLNERCRVFLDLAEILTDSIADTKMSTLTWIIIILILLSIMVTCAEVFLRFGILSSRGVGTKGPEGGLGSLLMAKYACDGSRMSLAVDGL
jgi:hypothetical protein